MGKKARGDSKIEGLPDHQFVEFRDGLLNRRFKSYEDARSWLLLECGLSVSVDTVFRFYHREVKPQLITRRKFAAMRSEAIGDALAANPVDYDGLTIKLVKEALFDLLDSESVDPKAAKDLWSIIKGDRQLSVDERKVTILETKATERDNAEAITKREDLTPEEKDAQLKQLFRMG